MSRTNNTALLVSLVACILVVVAAMLTAVLIAVQRPVVVVMPSGGDADAAADRAALLPLAGSASAPAAAPAAVATSAAASPSAPAPASPAPPPAAQPEVQCVRVAAVPDLQDLFAAAWESAPVAVIPLQPQQVAAPMLTTATIAEIQVQALRDDQRIAWRMSWAAPSPRYRSESGEFPDGVAMQFPLVDGAPFTMGARDMPVLILHWKSLWQKDVDEGFQDLAKLYPNSWNDLYWFVPGAGQVPIEQIAATPEARQFQVGLSAGNPMIQFDRKVPLEELVAEGFGTATTVPDSPSRARGEWKDGRWTVVIDRPLDAQDTLGGRLKDSPGGVPISLAVWDGSANNRGGLKHWCAWIPVRMDQ